MSKKDTKGLTVKKSENFSEWYTQVLQKAEMVDVRYNIKGFMVHRPWSALVIEKMYSSFEGILKRKNHNPHFFPTLIPEENFLKESGHVKGFSPEVFWVTLGGKNKLSKRLALRPTSETAFYQMFSLWIRSYKDLPFKTYQRANVFRYDTKATRPLLRDREFHWIETHCAFATEEDAMSQVREDIKTSDEVLNKIFCLNFLTFERPYWDKFPGAARTFAADVLNPDGRVVQQPSTHLISKDFSKAFDVKFKDKDEKERFAFLTCYGPGITRILASIIIVHGDDKGLRFPWEIAPKHIAIVPIGLEKDLIKKTEEIKSKLEKEGVDVIIDLSEDSPGEKFNKWELKGVPIRIDIGKNEIKKKVLSVFRRDTNKKETISEKSLLSYVKKVRKENMENLRKGAENSFKGKLKNAEGLTEIKKILGDKGIARCGFCSVEKEGVKCAEKIEKETGGEVRGTILDEKKSGGKCVICKKPAQTVVYIAKSY